MAAKAKNSKKSSDAKLVEAARGGDPGAFKALVRSYQARVFAYLSIRLTDSSQAEQMVTDVFRRMYFDLQNSEQFGEFEEELSRLTKLKLLQQSGRSSNGWTELCLAFDKKSGSQPPLKDSVRRRLSESIAGLDMAERQALDLRYGSGLSLARVSKRLKRSEDAVRGVLAGALGRVKKAMGTSAAEKKEAPGKSPQSGKSKGQRGKNG